MNYRSYVVEKLKGVINPRDITLGDGDYTQVPVKGYVVKIEDDWFDDNRMDKVDAAIEKILEYSTSK
jgi:hypothetical protein